MKQLHSKFVILFLLLSLSWAGVRVAVDGAGKIKRIDPRAGFHDGESGLDVLVLGTSHGLALRDLGVDSDVSIVNASQSGLGVAPLIVKCRFALAQVGRCRNVVIVVDEWQISSLARSEAAYAFDAYFFEREFLGEMMKEDFQRAVTSRYILGLFGNLPNLVYERFSGKKLEDLEEEAFVGTSESIGTISPQKAAGRAFSLYRGSTLAGARELSKKLAALSNYLTEESGKVEKVIFLFPPTPEVFREQSPIAAKDYKDVLISTLKGGNHEIHDFSDTRPGDIYYADEDHLTSDAARDFGRAEVIPLLLLN